MDVVFERVDARRYNIGILRNGRYDAGADVPLGPAPGRAEPRTTSSTSWSRSRRGLTLGGALEDVLIRGDQTQPSAAPGDERGPSRPTIRHGQAACPRRA